MNPLKPKPFPKPLPPPPPPPVPVTNFTKPPEVPALPPPPQITAPALEQSEPPVELKPDPPPFIPSNFDEYIATAKKVPQSNSAMKDFWASMAQADATNRVANALEELLGYLHSEEDDGGEDMPSLLSVEIANGVAASAGMVRDQLMAFIMKTFPSEFAEFKAIITSRIQDGLKEMKGAPPPRPGADIFRDATTEKPEKD